jgi:hypothetical protein
MKFVFKSIILGALAISAFSCKDKEIEKPDNLNPVKVTIEDILTGKFNDQTVMIDSVYFDHIAGTKFNNSGSNSCTSGACKTLRDCNSNALNLHTSTSDDWAYEQLPTKMGVIYGVVSDFNGIQLKLRSIDDVKEMTKTKCPEKFELITISEFLAGDYTDKLVKILDVEFDVNAANYGNGKFNGTTSNANGSKTLKDCFGNSTIVFTSTSSAWTNEPLPLGNGPIIAVGGIFNTTKQLLMRSLNDAAGMINANCTGGGGGGGTCTDYFCDDFEGGSLTGNNAWTVVNVIGSFPWAHKSNNGNYFAEANGYSGSAQNAETWIISPAINTSTATNPVLTFDNAKNFNGPDMQVYISTTYNGSGTINLADWTEITTFTKSAGSNAWAASGNIDLNSFKNTNMRVAFRYTSTTGTNTAALWRVDNVLVK